MTRITKKTDIPVAVQTDKPDRFKQEDLVVKLHEVDEHAWKLAKTIWDCSLSGAVYDWLRIMPALTGVEFDFDRFQDVDMCGGYWDSADQEEHDRSLKESGITLMRFSLACGAVESLISIVHAAPATSLNEIAVACQQMSAFKPKVGILGYKQTLQRLLQLAEGTKGLPRFEPPSSLPYCSYGLHYVYSIKQIFAEGVTSDRVTHVGLIQESTRLLLLSIQQMLLGWDRFRDETIEVYECGESFSMPLRKRMETLQILYEDDDVLPYLTAINS